MLFRSRRAAHQLGVRALQGQALQTAEPLVSGGFRLHVRGGGTLLADRLVLATGSHPSGLRMAVSLGHGRVPPVPSLFTLALDPHPLASLAGVVADPVVLELEAPATIAAAGEGRRRPERYRQRGPLLITHWGFSGPATLRLTAFAARNLQIGRAHV